MTPNTAKWNVIIARETFPWMGLHSGYEMLCEYLRKTPIIKNELDFEDVVKQPARKNNLTWALFRKLSTRIKMSRTYDFDGFKTEIDLLLRTLRRRNTIIHLLYTERMLGLLDTIPKAFTGPRVGTVHQPVSLWKEGRHSPEMVRSLDALIVLSKEKLDFFSEILPDKVHFIRHGVDTAFFHPNTQIKENQPDPRCVFSGVWLRDIETLSRVIEKVLRSNNRVQFDLLVPVDRRNDVAFKKISQYDQIHWHAGLSDEDLRRLYQRAKVLLLPLLDCTANNGLLEAMSCGVPVVSNAVGGIPDYTLPDFADLSHVGDANAMAEAVLRLIDDSSWQDQRGRQARDYVENNLDWNRISKETRLVYEGLIR